MTSKAELAERYFKQFENPIVVQFSTSPESCFFAGYDAAIARVLELLRSEEAIDKGSCQPIAADWIEKKLKGGGG